MDSFWYFLPSPFKLGKCLLIQLGISLDHHLLEKHEVIHSYQLVNTLLMDPARYLTTGLDKMLMLNTKLSAKPIKLDLDDRFKIVVDSCKLK
tara:strand:- start:89 stop:364 length:276 start_codon:yes stop_codon:yes gene_type:complete